MKFEHKKREEKKAHDLKRKDPEEVGRLVKTSQASAHRASVVKAAKRALRIQIAATTGMEYMGILFGGKHHI